MNILSAPEIKDLDTFTIANEPIASIDLMERAAGRCYDFINAHFSAFAFVVFCGTGNNGGDGLALARMLSENDYPVRVYILGDASRGSNDFKINLGRLQELHVEISTLNDVDSYIVLHEGEISIDAIFGIGIQREIGGFYAGVIDKINAYENPCISIDVPSGLFPDLLDFQKSSIIQADLTLTFHCLKRAFIFAENEIYVGDAVVLDIGLMDEFMPIESNFELLIPTEMQSLVHWRQRFSHKGIYGHLYLIGGSYGKIGALVLASKAALKMGIGLLTNVLPKCGYDIIQSAVPEAMCITDTDKRHLKNFQPIHQADAMGIGPGIGTLLDTADFLEKTIDQIICPSVLDADALNILSKNPDFMNRLPYECILTPHPKEFDRMFGEHDSSFERLKTLQLKAIELNVIIVLKGAYTRIAVPDGQVFINSTGNPGMATGGSGDVLTGMISALLAQNYTPEEACKLGVYIHGRAGDLAADQVGMTSMTASDIINSIPDAILELENASLL